MKYQSLGAVALALSLYSCRSETLLSANFNSDAVGSVPASALPGDPSGDQFYLSNSPGNLPNTVSVVSDPQFGNALRYSNVNQPVWNRFLGFIGAPADPSATGFNTTWSGKVNGSNSASALDIFFGDGHFLAMAGIRFKGGSVYLQNPDSTYELLGAYRTGVSHTVVISINRPANTYTLNISQAGGSLSSGTRPVLNPSATLTANPSLYFYYSEDLSSSGNYVMDDVMIRETFPD